MADSAPELPEMYWEKNGRLQIRSRFTGESLQDKALIEETYIPTEVKVVPSAQLIHLGGATIMDRGREALIPLVEEIVTARAHHDIVIGVGGGARERHTYALGTDLGLPTGALAAVGWMIVEQNAIMLFHLMAEHRAIEVPYLHYEMLPVYLREGSIPILMGMPSYYLWEVRPDVGRIPVHRPDTGAMLLAEVLTTKSCIYLKDVDGLYTEDPKKNPKAEFIPKISVDELIKMDLPDLPIERGALEVLQLARNRREIRIINGLERGALTDALNGKDVGTLIHQ